MSTETTIAQLHYWHIEEGGCVDHWAVAHTAEEALAVVQEHSEAEDDEEWFVEMIPDDQPHTVTFVDGFDDPEHWAKEAPPSAEFTVHRAGRWPQATAPAGEWARWHAAPCYTGCSEW